MTFSATGDDIKGDRTANVAASLEPLIFIRHTIQIAHPVQLLPTTVQLRSRHGCHIRH